MSARLFHSINGGQPRAKTADEMAAELCLETIEAIKERRAEAKAAEEACQPSIEWDASDQERINTLEALLKGRHRPVVLPLVLEHFPELVAMKVGSA